jgi:lysophospholipase L1-like esterase
MMATSGVALVAQGREAIPPEILAVGEIAGDLMPELAIVDLVAERISAPDTATRPDEPAEPIVAVLIEGESTSSSAGGWNRYPRDVALNMGDAVSVQVDGANGARISEVIAEGPKTHFLSDRDGQNVAVLWIGINDISEGTEPAEVYSGIEAWASSRRSEGWDRIALVTVPKFRNSISASNSSWGSHELADSMRSHLNELIVANSIGVDVVVDLRSVDGIGDGFSVEDKQWRPDGVHFTDAGYGLVAEHVTAALELVTS